MKRSLDERPHRNTWKLIWNVLMITDVFLNQKRVNVCDHTIKMFLWYLYFPFPHGFVRSLMSVCLFSCRRTRGSQNRHFGTCRVAVLTSCCVQSSGKRSASSIAAIYKVDTRGYCICFTRQSSVFKKIHKSRKHFWRRLLPETKRSQSNSCTDRACAAIVIVRGAIFTVCSHTFIPSDWERPLWLSKHIS